MIDITIRITADADQPLGDYELGILRAAAGTPMAVLEAAVEAQPVAAEAATDQPAAEATEAKPARKRRTRKPKEEAPEADTSSDEDDEDQDEPDAEPAADDPQQEAVDRARALMGAGKVKVVKEALGSLGAVKVSELKGKEIAAFLEALDEAELV